MEAQLLRQERWQQRQAAPWARKQFVVLDQYPELMTVEEVARCLRTTPAAVYERIRRGKVPGAVKDNRRVLVRRDRLVKYIEENSVAYAREDLA